MFRSIQGRIAFGFIVITVIGMAALGTYLSISVRDSLLENLRSELQTEAIVIAEASRPFLESSSAIGGLTTFVDELGDQIESRITVVRLDGIALADSQENAATMDNHANRPEIIGALENGSGESTRLSATTGERMLYVAVPVTSDSGIIGTARVALRLDRVDTYTGTMIPVIIVSLLSLTIVVILAAWLITRVTTRPIRQLITASRELAGGNFDYRIPVSPGGESGQLAQVFQEMSLKLKELIQTLSQDKARLSTILDNMADGIVTTDRDANIILINRAAERMLGIGHGEAVTRPLIEAVRDYELTDILKRCLSTGKAEEVQFETSMSSRFLRGIAMPIPGEHLRDALILLQDLTELRGIQTMRREIVGNISHDFRTPLAGIKAMVNTLQDGAMSDPEPAQDFLSRIEDEVDRLTQMVAELTELSRIETGRTELKQELVDLNELIRECVLHLNPQAKRQHLKLKTDLEEGLPWVTGDAERIRQVIVNLMHNAIKFNEPEGSVTASTRRENERISVSIRDTGSGIASQDLPRIFERFYKSDKSRTGQGSGMGLAIAKHIIEAHGGTISAVSIQGKGSTFTFRIPVMPPAAGSGFTDSVTD